MIRVLARKARTVVTNPRKARETFDVLADLTRMRLESQRALHGARVRRTPGPVVLIVSLSEFIYQVKLEGVLAKALQLDGYIPVVLTLPGTRFSERYFRAVGVDRFVYPTSFASPGADEEVEAAAAAALSGDVTVQGLKGLEFHGARVGQQALSTVSRRFQQGRLTLDDPAVRAVLEEVLRDCMRAVLVGEALLDRLQPEIVIFNEKGYAGFGSIYDVALARGANVLQFVSAGIHWRDALLFKRYTEQTRRVHPASLSADSWERVRVMPWTEERQAALDEEFAVRYGPGEKHPDAGLQQGKAIKSREQVVRQLGLDPAKRTAVIYSHVLWDANLFYGDDLFDDQELWLVESAKAAVANSAVNWIVKLHPANSYKAQTAELNDEVAIREAVGELPPHVALVRPETDINTFSLFEAADWGVTIRGTIGMELPCYGVPVLTAGTGRYSGLGFTNDSSTAAEYLDKLAHIHDIPPLDEETTLLARRHAYALFRLRPFRFTSYAASFTSPGPRHHPLGHNLRWLLRTPEQVENAPDLIAWSAWARGRELDYLAEVA